MPYINIQLAAYVIKAAIRDKLIISMALVFIMGICLSMFIGSSALTENDAAILTFAASAGRLIGVISLILFSVFYLRRAFETHDIEFLLARPLDRPTFILSHLVALSVLSVLFAGFMSGAIMLIPGLSVNYDGLFLWTVSIAFEFMIVVFAAFFFAMVLPSAVTSTMATLAGYTLARMSGQILNIIDAGGHSELFSFLAKIMEAASVIVPRFDLFSQSSWLVYGPDTNIGLMFIGLHGALFLVLIGCAAIFDLLRKEF